MAIEGNPMKILQYDVTNGMSLCCKYKEKMFSIPVYYINFFIAILCYHLQFYDVLRSPVCYTYQAMIITKLGV